MTLDEERGVRDLQSVRAVYNGKVFTDRLDEALGKVREMLILKNERYGNSALEPVRIFSKCDRREQIRVRMDDKLSRIMQGHLEDDEDPQRDLLGYMVLDLIAERLDNV